MVWDSAVANNETLQRQYTRITKERKCLDHDDELESLAMCARQFGEFMYQDPDRTAELAKEEHFRTQLEEHRELLQINNKTEPRWYTLYE